MHHDQTRNTFMIVQKYTHLAAISSCLPTVVTAPGGFCGSWNATAAATSQAAMASAWVASNRGAMDAAGWPTSSAQLRAVSSSAQQRLAAAQAAGALSHATPGLAPEKAVPGTGRAKSVASLALRSGSWENNLSSNCNWGENNLSSNCTGKSSNCKH